jgi:hypothetical protein
MLKLALNLSKTCQKYFKVTDSPVAPPDRQASIAGRLPSGKFDRRTRPRHESCGRAKSIRQKSANPDPEYYGMLSGGIASASRDAARVNPRLARAIVRAA